jgi:aminopeptidase N
MRKVVSYFLLSYLILSMGCKVNKSFDSNSAKNMEKIMLDDVVIRPQAKVKTVPYQPMPKRVVDLLHTKLELAFDYDKQWVIGKAFLTIKPYFLPVQNFTLDAKGFEIQQIKAVLGKDTLALTYQYDTFKIDIQLPKELKRTDTFQVILNYIAKPSELKNKGGSAITDNKGLYFINPKETDPYKPKQIWTQGEAENSSAWFPTIDVPGEKHTQEIFITIAENETSLSNGLLMSSKKIGNGLKIEHWSQKLPHAPYLAMLAIGNFTVTKDKWRDKEVNYYLEPAYQKHAKMIFGKTPKMIEVYSKLTGVDYPWEKFSQVVARDFVSGAMENTGAVLHYEGVQHDARQHLDNNHEDIIAHELFHQWFGDYVTARTWSQLPLNESFATYGEYLWNEAEYGKDFADYQFERSRNAYFRSKNKHTQPTIRYFYSDPDELFDVLSYQKGGRILHMLRNQLGDEVFFKGINLYLTKNAFGIADIHDLRKAFEQASGEDLNLFFNQWFLGSGHPIVQVKYDYNVDRKSIVVKVMQVKDSLQSVFNSSQSVFSFPVKIGIGDSSGLVITESIIISKKYEEFEFPYNQIPDYISFDEDGVLLGQLAETKSNERWLNQFLKSKNYGTYNRANDVIKKWNLPADMPLFEKAIRAGITNETWFKQIDALNLLNTQPALIDSFKNTIINLSFNHPVSKVRTEALVTLSSLGKESLPYLIKSLGDSSYMLVSTSLGLIGQIDLDTAIYFANQQVPVSSGEIHESIAELYAKKGNINAGAYFKSQLGKYGLYRSPILRYFGDYITKSILKEGEWCLQILDEYISISSDTDLDKRVIRMNSKIRKQLVTEMKVAPENQQEFYNKLLEQLNNIDKKLKLRSKT